MGTHVLLKNGKLLLVILKVKVNQFQLLHQIEHQTGKTFYERALITDFFVDFTFFTYAVWGRNKNFNFFFQNFSKFFEVFKWSEWILRYDRALKSDFLFT